MARKARGTPKEVEKAESTPDALPVGSLLSQERGQPRIVSSNYFIQDQKRKELAMPTRLCTFDSMANDDAVNTSIFLTNIHVINSLYHGEYKGNTDRGKKAAAFLNYNIRNMRYGTWLQALTNFSTDIKYGWSHSQMVVKPRSYGPYAGMRCLEKISPRDQKSVYGWIWDKDNRNVLGFVQKQPLVNRNQFDMRQWTDGLRMLSVGKLYENKYPILRTEQLLWFKYNSTNNNPQGDSPLLHCWQAWKEKELIERFEVIGISKDNAGVVVLKVPLELLERASEPSTYPVDYASLQALKLNAEKLQAGESSCIIIMSDHDETTNNPKYDFKLQGIEGSGKQFDIDKVIQRKQKSIYNTFGTGYILLGQENVGSYSLALTAQNTHAFYVEKNILEKVDVLNNQFAPRMLAANDIYLDWKDMPYFVAADPTELDLEVLSKAVMRMKSVGGLTEKATKFLYEKAGLPIDGVEELDFSDPKTTKVGQSQGSSGTGNTQAGGASSATNGANKSLIKDFVLDNGYVIDMETGDLENFKQQENE